MKSKRCRHQRSVCACALRFLKSHQLLRHTETTCAREHTTADSLVLFQGLLSGRTLRLCGYPRGCVDVLDERIGCYGAELSTARNLWSPAQMAMLNCHDRPRRPSPFISFCPGLISLYHATIERLSKIHFVQALPSTKFQKQGLHESLLLVASPPDHIGRRGFCHCRFIGR